MLLENLKKVTEGVYPFHMPGHKRQKDWTEGLLDADLTEVTDTDDLHHPTGIIAEAQKRAAALYGSVSTIFVTGGSTCSLLSAISAVTRQGDSIVIARNCHKSVYNACLLNRLCPEYVYPSLLPRMGCFGEVSAAEISAALDKSGAKVVVITSPTYEGVISDVKAISRVVHKKGGILIVDSAHGAHLGLSDYFPESARSLGADIVVESAHKTLPCLTGASLLHICSHRVSYGEIQNALGIFETSSPSYPILCSIDRAITRLADGKAFALYAKRLEDFYAFGKTLSHISLFESGTFDRGKLVIYCGDSNLTGFELKERLLREFNIETEMAMPRYLLAMTSVADTDLGFERLKSALDAIDTTLKKGSSALFLPPPAAISVGKLWETGDIDFVKVEEAAHRVSAEFIYAYPPGSPILAPSERICPQHLDYLGHLYSAGAQIYSSVGIFPEKIAVLKEKY